MNSSHNLGLLGASVSIMVLGWLGFCMLLSRSSMGLTWGQIAIPFITLLIQILLFASLALVLSMVVPSRNLAAMISGALLVINYMLPSLSFMNKNLEAASKLLPFHYFQPVLSFQELNLAWLFSLLGISLLMVYIAWLRFSHRDIRLSGEGSWRRT